MKKSIFTVTFLILAGIIFTSQAQDLKEVLNKYSAASGVDKWVSVKSATMKAKIEQMGMEIPMEMKLVFPNKFRVDMEIQDQKIIQAFDGEKGWMINPFAGATEPQDMEGDQLKQAMNQADLKGELYNYAEKGSTAELIGKETIDGKEYYNIKLTSKDGAAKNYYIDAATFLIGRVKMTVNAQGQEMEIEQLFPEYAVVKGISMPKKIESKTPMGSAIITFTDHQFDVAIDENIFKKPAK